MIIIVVIRVIIVKKTSLQYALQTRTNGSGTEDVGVDERLLDLLERLEIRRAHVGGIQERPTDHEHLRTSVDGIVRGHRPLLVILRNRTPCRAYPRGDEKQRIQLRELAHRLHFLGRKDETVRTSVQRHVGETHHTSNRITTVDPLTTHFIERSQDGHGEQERFGRHGFTQRTHTAHVRIGHDRHDGRLGLAQETAVRGQGFLDVHQLEVSEQTHAALIHELGHAEKTQSPHGRVGLDDGASAFEFVHESQQLRFEFLGAFAWFALEVSCDDQTIIQFQLVRIHERPPSTSGWSVRPSWPWDEWLPSHQHRVGTLPAPRSAVHDPRAPRADDRSSPSCPND